MSIKPLDLNWDTERETERERERERDRQTEIEIEREIQRDRERERQRKRETKAQREIERNSRECSEHSERMDSAVLSSVLLSSLSLQSPLLCGPCESTQAEWPGSSKLWEEPGGTFCTPSRTSGGIGGVSGFKQTPATKEQPCVPPCVICWINIAN